MTASFCLSSGISSDIPSSSNQRFGFVTLCGAPNAGKSTLLNCLAGEKVAAVSDKPQTTRFNIITVKEYGTAQVAFVDTPGLFRPTNETGRLLRRSSLHALKSTDVVVVLIDISLKDQAGDQALVRGILNQFTPKGSEEDSGQPSCPILLAFNKIDKVKEHDIVARAFPFQQFANITDFFMISAATGEGTDPLLERVLACLPKNAWAYPPRSALQMDLKRWLSEMTMEKVFEHLHQEIPYQTYVETLSLQEDEDGLHIFQNLVLAKEGQKRIAIGHKGYTLRTIGKEARQNMGGALKRRVHLHLFVKVKESWMEKSSCLVDAGLKGEG